MKEMEMKPTAILLMNCPDRKGIIADVTKFITDNHGNVVDLDQYVDNENGVFFMRIEWELEGFLIPGENIRSSFQELFSERLNMDFNIFFSDVKPRMAIFVSKQSHCLYDLLARYMQILSEDIIKAYDLEKIVLSRAVTKHIERKILTATDSSFRFGNR